MNGGSGEKRVGTLPIFARKRPRVALLAFSSSQNPVTTPGRSNTSMNTQERSYLTPSEKENYQHYGGNKPVANWRPYKPPTTGHVTRPPLPAPPPQTSAPQWNTSRDSFNDKPSSISFPPTQDIPLTKPLIKDVKPLIKEDVNTSRNLLLKSVHMLTATSQGVQHWSKYQPQMNLVFEVYGTLTSHIQSGELGAKRFTLQAVDGPLNCWFWEIDYKIPASLVRGHLCRVVGTWDTHKSIFKCASVRSSDRKEFSCVKNMVSISDQYMRQIVLSLHET
ncbi:spermatogenesis-associated protein 22-like [Dysidea avara]|uniref:spermatogenesis-associated protein 22-like n=1 Tax=Dysidea avara TaxID=196820 RepID=UPI00332A89B5